MKIKIEHFFIFTFLISFSAIVFAYYYQYVENYPPCELCIYQRFPYFALILISISAIIFRKFLNLLSYSVIFALFLSFIISFFHLGVEQNFWTYDTACSNNIKDFENVDQLRDFLNEVPITKCNQVIWSFLGISMAGYNSIFSLVNLILLTSFRYRLYYEN